MLVIFENINLLLGTFIISYPSKIVPISENSEIINSITVSYKIPRMLNLRAQLVPKALRLEFR